MAFNPIPAPDPKTWELTIDGLDDTPLRLKAADLDRLPQRRAEQPAEMRAVLVGTSQLGGLPLRGSAPPDG